MPTLPKFLRQGCRAFPCAVLAEWPAVERSALYAHYELQPLIYLLEILNRGGKVNIKEKSEHRKKQAGLKYPACPVVQWG